MSQEEFLKERIKALQNDTKLYFKQTNEIIEIAYNSAIKDCNEFAMVPLKPIKQIPNQDSKINDLKAELNATNALLQSYKDKLKKISDNQKESSNKWDKIEGKLEAYNRIYDLIYGGKDLMDVYGFIKNEISDLISEKRMYGR